MIKFLSITMILFNVTIASAQTPSYVTVLESFKNNFNTNNPQGVFNLFGDAMQEQVNLETVTAIVATFASNFGSIKEFQFLQQQGQVETYLTIFEKGKQKTQLVLNESNQIIGLLFQPYDDPTETALFDRNTTPLQLPFKGEWFTFWGGDNKAINYHVTNKTQRGAFDFVIRNKRGQSFEKSGTRNEDYFAFGKPLYAVCDATVHKVITGIKDNKPGEMNASQPTGNTVILKTKNEEFIVYAHFEEGTIQVKEGDYVKKGQKLGACGNSGNSSEPHLHLHIQDSDNMLDAFGAKTFFEKIIVNGEVKEDYSPVQGDFISAIEE